MFVFAIVMTVAAVAGSLVVMLANGMRSSPGKFVGGSLIGMVWILAAFAWLDWWMK